MQAQISLRWLVALFLLCLSAGCGSVLDGTTGEIYDARYRDDGDRIRRSDAIAYIMPAVFNLSQRCGADNLYFLSAAITRFSCNLDELAGTDPAGCANFDFIDRAGVEYCRLILDATQCDGSTESFSGVVPAFLICRSIFSQGSFSPTG